MVLGFGNWVTGLGVEEWGSRWRDFGCRVYVQGLGLCLGFRGLGNAVRISRF